MNIIKPNLPQVVAQGQATTYITELPAVPVAGTFYTVADSTRINVLKPYTNTVLLYDGSDYVVQVTPDGGDILINGQVHYYSPASGFIPEGAYGIKDEVGGVAGVGGGAGALTPADITAAVNAASVTLSGSNIDMSNADIVVNTQQIEDLLEDIKFQNGAPTEALTISGLDNGVFQNIQAPSGLNYRYAVITPRGADPEDVVIRTRGIEATASPVIGRIFNATKGCWERSVCFREHTYIVPLYTANDFVVDPSPNESPDLTFSVVFTNEEIDIEESGAPPVKLLNDSQVLDDTGIQGTGANALEADKRRMRVMIQNKSNSDTIYWNTIANTTDVVNQLNSFELLPKQFVVLDGLEATRILRMFTDTGVTGVRYNLRVESI